MVREGQRYEPPACEPRTDVAEGDPACEFPAWGSGCVGDGLVAIGPAERLQPTGSVKNGGLRVPLDEFRPTGITKRSDTKNRQIPPLCLARARDPVGQGTLEKYGQNPAVQILE